MTAEAKDGVLLCWHAHVAGAEVLYNALAALRRQHRLSIDRVLYLVQPEDEAVPVDERNAGAAIDRRVVPLAAPTDHAAILAALREHVLPSLRGLRALHVNVSPGTPAMHAVWLVLHAGAAFPPDTRLWSSQRDPATGRTRIDPVAFPVTTWLAESRSAERVQPDRPHYDPDARSPARRAALDRLIRYAGLPGAPLLVLGERGTGKTRTVEELVRVIKRREVVTVPCGALESTVAESALFGHARGAFTGAEREREGALGRARDRVLFLDEVQDLPRAVQRKLVRVLQAPERRYRRMGEDDERTVDFDIVCASNLPVTELRARLDPDHFSMCVY